MKNPAEILAAHGLALLGGVESALQAIRQPVRERQKYKGVQWGESRITWPDRAPHFATWGGNQTLVQIIRSRQQSLRGKITDPLTYEAPINGVTGIDPVSANLDSRDVGFSVNALKMPVLQRPAIEMLAILALEVVPLISYAPRQVGIEIDENVYRWTVEKRGDKGYFRWGWIK